MNRTGIDPASYSFHEVVPQPDRARADTHRAGHGRAYPVDKPLLPATEQKLRKQQQLFGGVLPEGEVNFGLDPSWVKIYPYQMLLAPGGRQRAEVRVRNYKASPMKIEVAIIAPSEWRI